MKVEEIRVSSRSQHFLFLQVLASHYVNKDPFSPVPFIFPGISTNSTLNVYSFCGTFSQLIRINTIDTKCILLGQILSWGLEPGLFIPNKVQIIPDSRLWSGCCLPSRGTCRNTGGKHTCRWVCRIRYFNDIGWGTEILLNWLMIMGNRVQVINK